MLIDHRIDDVDKRFVTVEQSVSSGKNIAFEPALLGIDELNIKQ